jgi:hypothetical protein
VFGPCQKLNAGLLRWCRGCMRNPTRRRYTQPFIQLFNSTECEIEKEIVSYCKYTVFIDHIFAKINLLYQIEAFITSSAIFRRSLLRVEFNMHCLVIVYPLLLKFIYENKEAVYKTCNFNMQ